MNNTKEYEANHTIITWQLYLHIHSKNQKGVSAGERHKNNISEVKVLRMIASPPMISVPISSPPLWRQLVVKQAQQQIQLVSTVLLL